MERLTKRINGKAAFHECSSTCGTCEGVLCGSVFLMADRLAAYEDAMPIERAQELAQAEKDGRLVVLESAVREGEKKPSCFCNDMGQALCLGFARGEYDDEPIDRCKECWYCESTHEEAEAALKMRWEADNETD